MWWYPKFWETEYPCDNWFFPSVFDENGEPVDVSDIWWLDIIEARETFWEAAVRAVEEIYWSYEYPESKRWVLFDSAG